MTRAGTIGVRMQAADPLDMDSDLIALAANENARRRRAHRQARRHSMRVRALRFVIPVAAGIAVLGLGAVVAYRALAPSLPNVTLGPVSVTGTKVTMENPRLSGFRKGDRGYEVTATAALQDVRKPALIELQTMKGHLATDDKGGLAYLEAKNGLFDSARESLTLDHDIRLWTDKGEEIRLNSAAVDFKAGTVKSSEPVAVTVPSGRIDADTLDVVDNGKVISFVGNVHAVFHGTDKADRKPAAMAEAQP
ncbi:hypothetical protein LKMONMHP_0346 [Methylobacterium organophilum]|uniref:Lipopolysaccharide-assembly, LptC-related protein n=2 Tax=Methylobacterium organophilum TaxID=410 RepID=A0ABQ4T2Q7_METOR|nr:hypothetical protein LKMONMHP_0346 [Methylobacterium organophilum]